MILVLDTSILIEIERGNQRIIEKISELRKQYPRPAKISFVSYFEFLYGLRNKVSKNKKEPLEFIEKFSVIQTSKDTANILIDMKEKYRLPLADLLIASHVKEINGVLVTKDRDFSQIEDIEKIVVQ